MFILYNYNMITTICLIRHGQTDWNNQLIIQGRKNIPLNKTGLTQANETGELLKKIDPTWDIIMSSPLDRAITTASIIKNKINFSKDIIIDDRFIEREFGKAEGMPIEDEIYKRIEDDDVEGLEKGKELEDRIYNAVMDTAAKYQGKKIIIATHSHSIKGLLIRLNIENSYQKAKVLNTALNYFYIEDGKVIDYKLNIK